jgi:hypothetical protein
VVSFSVLLLLVVSEMKPLKIEQSDTLNSNKTENETTKARTIKNKNNKSENETTKTRTIRYIKEQQNRMKPPTLEICCSCF